MMQLDNLKVSDPIAGPKNKYANVVAVINVAVVLMNDIFSKLIFRSLLIGVLPSRQIKNNPIAAADIIICLTIICLNELKSNRLDSIPKCREASLVMVRPLNTHKK
jgi:hypothetical protein